MLKLIEIDWLYYIFIKFKFNMLEWDFASVNIIRAEIIYIV